jgi:hypothetical protein
MKSQTAGLELTTLRYICRSVTLCALPQKTLSLSQYLPTAKLSPIHWVARWKWHFLSIFFSFFRAFIFRKYTGTPNNNAYKDLKTAYGFMVHRLQWLNAILGWSAWPPNLGSSIKGQAREGPGSIVLCDWFVSTCVSRINVLSLTYH